MTKSQMLPSVLQAVTLSALGTIVYHHLMNNVAEFTTNSELFSNYTKAIGFNDQNITKTSDEQPLVSDRIWYQINATHNATITMSRIDNTTSTTKTPPTSDKNSKPFYSYTFPRALFVIVIGTICDYYWQVWLERTFPGRLRPADFPPEKASTSESDDLREEAVVQKWIAQGKVKRASLNWWNTFVKWVVDMSVGTLWMQVLQYLLSDVLLDWSVKDFQKDKRWWLKWEILIRCVVSFIDIRPLMSLVSFIIIPAHKRIVFLAGADLVWAACFGLLVGRVMPLLESNELVQTVLKNMTQAANDQRDSAGPVVLTRNETRLSDEL